MYVYIGSYSGARSTRSLLRFNGSLPTQGRFSWLWVPSAGILAAGGLASVFTQPLNALQLRTGYSLIQVQYIDLLEKRTSLVAILSSLGILKWFLDKLSKLLYKVCKMHVFIWIVSSVYTKRFFYFEKFFSFDLVEQICRNMFITAMIRWTLTHVATMNQMCYAKSFFLENFPFL